MIETVIGGILLALLLVIAALIVSNIHLCITWKDGADVYAKIWFVRFTLLSSRPKPPVKQPIVPLAKTLTQVQKEKAAKAKASQKSPSAASFGASKADAITGRRNPRRQSKQRREPLPPPQASLSQKLRFYYDLVTAALSPIASGLRLKVCTLRIVLGGDPAKSAVEYGAILSLLHTAAAAAYDNHHWQISDKHVGVVCDFTSDCSTVDADIRLSIRLYHVARAAINALIVYLTKKGR